ncbi:MAG: hypothetical protein NVS3B2_04570 [Ramlibacter sp.]
MRERMMWRSITTMIAKRQSPRELLAAAHAVEREFRAAVEAFLVRHGMAAATFGKMAMGNTAFVLRMRAGRRSTLYTMARVTAFMEAHAKAHGRRVRPARSLAMPMQSDALAPWMGADMEHMGAPVGAPVGSPDTE